MTIDSTSSMGDLAFRPLTPRFAAEVIGLDAAGPISAAQAEALRSAYAHFQVLVLRNQTLPPQAQADFGHIFGDIEVREHNKVKSTDGTQHVSNTRADGVFGSGELNFHIDQLFYQEPLAALMLYGIEVPPVGGDTLFCDTSQVLAAMPDALRSRIETLRCRTGRNYDAKTANAYNVSIAPETVVSAEHPMVWTEPTTGRKAIWVNRPELTTTVVDLEPDDGSSLMADIRNRIETSDAVYRHQWRAGDLVLWNNRTLHHARTLFDASLPRTLRRTALMERRAA